MIGTGPRRPGGAGHATALPVGRPICFTVRGHAFCNGTGRDEMFSSFGRSPRDTAAARELVVKGIRSCAILGLADSDARASLDDSEGDCSLDSLGFDSLAQLELASWLDAEAGIQVSEDEIGRAETVMGLAALVAART